MKRRYSKESGLGAKVIFGAFLFAVEVTCQGHSAELLKPLGNQTVVLGAEAHFSCLLVGREENLRLRIDGRLTALPFFTPNLVIRVERSQRVDGLTISNVSIDITATRERNMTRIECYDVTMDSAAFSVALLTVRGGPGKLEVKYEVERDKREILLSWQRPFTWEDYPITGYVIECRDRPSIINYIINDTDTASRSFVNHTVELPHYVPDCYSLQCCVTAYNLLDGSIPSVSNFSFPSLKPDLRSRVLVVKQTKLQDNEYEIFICVELPVLCDFQSVVYSVVFSRGGDPVLELYRGFNYSSGYTSECIEEAVGRELEEGVEYSVQVFVDAGEGGNSSSLIHTFILTPSRGSDCEGRFETCLVAAGASAALSLLVFLPVGVLLGACGTWCCMKRDKGRYRQSSPRRRSQRGEEPHYDEPLPVTHNMAYASRKKRST